MKFYHMMDRICGKLTEQLPKNRRDHQKKAEEQ